MFNKMRLSYKIMSGFVLVLLVTALVGYVGINGFNKTRKAVVVSDQIGGLVDIIGQCRYAELDYRAESKPENLKRVKELLEEVTGQLAKVSLSWNSTGSSELANVVSSIEQYSTGFDRWVLLHSEQLKSEEKMEAEAQEFMIACQNIKGILTDKMELVRSESASHIAAVTANADSSVCIENAVKDSRLSMYDYMVNKNTDTIKTVNDNGV
ncbi:MAG: hypothetical protein JXM68_04320, partial [Sedimentisphaerales bacterium]|nr:hypothetical protein [Sedimentisphaerales bacterium]